MCNLINSFREINTASDNQSNILGKYVELADKNLQDYLEQIRLNPLVKRRQGISIIIKSIKQINPNFSEPEIQQMVLRVAEDLLLKQINLINELDFSKKIHSEEKQAELIALANKVAEKDPRSFASNIQKFGIQADTQQGQEALIALATIVAEKAPFF